MYLCEKRSGLSLEYGVCIGIDGRFTKGNICWIEVEIKDQSIIHALRNNFGDVKKAMRDSNGSENHYRPEG